MDKDHLAKELYTTYCAGVGGKAFNGDNLPTASDFFSDPSKEKQVNAWRLTAEKAVEILK